MTWCYGEPMDRLLRCDAIKRQEDVEELVAAARERSGLAGD